MGNPYTPPSPQLRSQGAGCYWCQIQNFPFALNCKGDTKQARDGCPAEWALRGVVGHAAHRLGAGYAHPVAACKRVSTVAIGQ